MIKKIKNLFLAMAVGLLTIAIMTIGVLAADDKDASEKLKRPEITKCEMSSWCVSFDWKPVPGATYYKVYRKCNGYDDKTLYEYEDDEFKCKGKVTATHFDDLECGTGLRYSYKVVAYNDTTKSNASEEYNTMYNPFYGFSLEYGNENEIFVDVQEFNNYDKYVIWRKKLGTKKWEKIASIDGKEERLFYRYVDKTTKNGRHYEYRMQAIQYDDKVTGNIIKSEYEIHKISTLKAPKPRINSHKKTFDVNWDRIGGARSYFVTVKYQGIGEHTRFYVKERVRCGKYDCAATFSNEKKYTVNGKEYVMYPRWVRVRANGKCSSRLSVRVDSF